ncbi:uncharacterized protein LOC124137133 isoform X2 [Haliotis rufescens]|uniref:uncharacterized protein LOC124137133 isoform X2 n=1 Tax=Haliotis rufescens TaxID=6454 RepID=UPI00201F78FE|nr:uncharacterized protein LOC124137133 isoform X2 [Haliotis rufescens]
MGLTAMYVERAFVVCVHFLLAAHGDTRTGNRCIEGLPGSFTVQLNCSAGEWIHVKNEAYGDGDTTTCRLKYDLSCSRVHNSSQNGLIVNCNGKQLCRETIQPTPRTNCNFTDAAAEVQYNCIQGSMDLCSTETTVHGSVYLHSPGFPDSVGVNSSCIVRITGQNIRVTLVEERMKTGLLNISGDGKQLWTSVNVNQYNRLLQATADEVVVVVYDNHGQNGSNVWIRVEASGQMNITSTRQISDVSATSVTPSTQQPSRSPGTTSQSTSATPTTATTTSTPSITMNQSTTEAVTANLTTKETTTSPTTPDTGLIVWVASASSGCIITIVIVVIAVVLCRRKDVKTSRPYDPPDNASFESPFELSSMNIEKVPYGSGQNESSNVSGSGEPILHTESRYKTGNYKRPMQDQYSTVLPRSSRLNTYDNSKFTAPSLMIDPVGSTTDNDHNDMTENDLYNGGFASRDDTSIEAGMVDNGLYDKFEYDREKGSVHGESDTSPSIRKQTIKENCDMIENDVYNGGPPLPADHVGSKDDNDNPDKRSISTEISNMTEHDLYDGGLDTGDDTGGGMVDNELYDKFGHDRERDSIQDESDASPSNVFDKNVEDDEASVMVSNGLYHSFK